MKIKFWGVRGSIPVPGASTLKYGGNTPCVQITSSTGDFVILDAGTGIRELGKSINKNFQDDVINIFISHTHWDHIQGIPFFPPLYKDFQINFFLYSSGIPSDHFIDAQLNPNYFPVTKDAFQAKINFHNIFPKQKYKSGNLSIETCEVFHSKGTLSFKITEKGKTVVYMTDNEIQCGDCKEEPDLDCVYIMNKELLEFCEGCDYLIHDSMYMKKNFASKKGWGHSSNFILSYFGHLAKVKNLILFHYETSYNDKKIDLMVCETKDIIKKLGTDINCIPAIEGHEISF